MYFTVYARFQFLRLSSERAMITSSIINCAQPAPTIDVKLNLGINLNILLRILDEIVP